MSNLTTIIGLQMDKLEKLSKYAKALEERLEVSPDHDWDGIDARDATIRYLEAEFATPEQWQPIETAPKGESILLYGGEVHEGFWDELDYDEFRGQSIMGWNYGCAVIDQTNFCPTHWMPLPAGPTPEEKNGD